MDNMNVMSDVGNSLIKVEPVEVKKGGSASTVSEKNVIENHQAQKVADKDAVKKITTQPELENVVHEINNMMVTVQRDLNFSIDENSGRKVISVYEKGTDKLIRQLPSEEALKILDNLEQLKGLLFKTDV